MKSPWLPAVLWAWVYLALLWRGRLRAWGDVLGGALVGGIVGALVQAELRGHGVGFGAGEPGSLPLGMNWGDLAASVAVAGVAALLSSRFDRRPAARGRRNSESAAMPDKN